MVEIVRKIISSLLRAILWITVFAQKYGRIRRALEFKVDQNDQDHFENLRIDPKWNLYLIILSSYFTNSDCRFRVHSKEQNLEFKILI